MKPPPFLRGSLGGVGGITREAPEGRGWSTGEPVSKAQSVRQRSELLVD